MSTRIADTGQLSTELERLTRSELYLVAKKIKVRGTSRLTKPELIKKLLECHQDTLREVLELTWWDKHHNAVYGLSSIIAIPLAIILCVVGLKYMPLSRQAGTLKPRYPQSNKNTIESYTGVGTDQTSQIFTVQLSEGVVLQPLGRYAPFSISKDTNGLLISAVVRSLDGRIVAKIHNNEWVLNPNNYFRKNFDKSALEVIDEYDIPVLQIEYLTENHLKLGGIFYLEEKEISELYPDFPTTPKDMNPRAVISLRGTILTMGKGGYMTISRNTSPMELRNKASHIETWFDYSKPNKLGVRK
jgi:hypothetical protein